MSLKLITKLYRITTPSYLQKLRGISTWWLQQNPQQCGGVGIICEIDESLMAKVSTYILSTYCNIFEIWIHIGFYLDKFFSYGILLKSDFLHCRESTTGVMRLDSAGFLAEYVNMVVVFFRKYQTGQQQLFYQLSNNTLLLALRSTGETLNMHLTSCSDLVQIWTKAFTNLNYLYTA